MSELEQWVIYRQGQLGTQPAPDVIDQHIANDLTPQYFSTLHQRALDLFGQAALTFLKPDMEAAERDAVEQAVVQSVNANMVEATSRITDKLSTTETIVSQAMTGIRTDVAKAGSFWRQLALSVVTAVLAPLLVGLGFLLYKSYDRNMPNSSQIEQKLANPDSVPGSSR